jgi:WD40 repeat protein
MSRATWLLSAACVVVAARLCSAAEPIQIDAHSGAVTAVAYSGDGSLLLTAGTDGLVKLWDPATGKLRKELKGHKGRVNAAGFLPGGKSAVRVGSEGDSGEVKVWDLEKGEATDLRAAKKPIHSVAVSGDGKWLAWDEGNAVTLWDVEKKESAPPLYGLTPTPEDGGLAFSSDDKLLAGACRYGAVVWALKPKPVAKAIRCPKPQDPTGIAFTADGLLALPSRRHVVGIVDPTTGKLVENIGGLGEKALGVAVTRDGKTIACGVGDGVRLWDASTRKEVATLKSPAGKGHVAGRLAFSPDGTRLATANVTPTSGAVRIWDVSAETKR